MRYALLVFFMLLTAMPARATSYLCRSDGSVHAFESGDEVEVVKPLRQNEIEEMTLPSGGEPKNSQPVQAEPRTRSPRSIFVPLTQKDIEERGRGGDRW